MSSDQVLLLTREQLYERVWATPMRGLAQELGLSDVGLAKACRKEKIPVPGRGYWAKRAAGRKLKRPALPAAPEAAAALEFHLDRRTKRDGTRKPPPAPVDIPRIPVATVLTDPHPLVVLTLRRLAAALRRRAIGSDSPVQPLSDGEKHGLDLAVGAALIDRALCVTDAVCKALEARGFTIDPDFVNRSWIRTVAKLGPDVVVFRVIEQTRQVPYVPTQEERERNARDPRYHKLPKWGKEPAGLLELQFAGPEEYGWKSRRENSRTSVEEMVGTFVAGVVELAAREKAQREEREASWERQREEERRRYEQETREREEQARVEQLLCEVTNWRKAEEIRAYAAAVRAALTARGQEDGEATKLGRWLVWAAAVADRYDPLVP